jgi:hypothetical protein
MYLLNVFDFTFLVPKGADKLHFFLTTRFIHNFFYFIKLQHSTEA